MATTTKVEIKRDIYFWAFRESQRDFESIRDRFKKLDAWLSGDTHPTFRQVQKLANFLKVPLGYMFLDKPPKGNLIESEFRTIGNKVPETSKDLQDTLFSIGRKKDWLSEYRKKKGWGKIISSGLDGFDRNDINQVSQIAKDFIGLDDYWYKLCRDHAFAFNYLREKLESKGIIVMQNGVVGSNNHRKLNVREFRGFLLYDDVAPFIFINNRDSVTGKIFTLIHEYLHFMLQKDDVFIDSDLTMASNDEAIVNKTTAEFLIPSTHVKENWDNSKPEIEQIEKLGRLFHASRLAVAIKLKEMHKIGQHIVNEIKQQTEAEQEVEKPGPGGGRFYPTNKSRFGESFMGAVIQGAEAGDISYTYAFKLLGGSSKMYDYYKEEFMSYGR